MRLSITLLLLASVSLVMAQNTKIDEQERVRLENQFKALKTFYINDDGLVVYQVQEGVSKNKAEDAQPESTSSNTTAKVVEEPTSNKRAKQERKAEPIKYEQTNKSSATVAPLYSISKAPIDPNQLPNTTKSTVNEAIEVAEYNKTPDKVEPKQTIKSVTKNGSKTSTSAETKKVQEAVKAEQTKKAQTEIAKVDDNKTLEAENTEERTSTTENKKTSKYPYKKYEFEKNPSKYKNMEEAALAVDDLLEKLKKEDTQTGSTSRSMSSRIARGAGKSSLRKQPIDQNDLDNYTNTPHANPIMDEIYNEMDDVEENTYIPTYYINGEQVTKTDVDNLKKKDIVSREVRTRNTRSGNPAGEVWIEVKIAK